MFWLYIWLELWDLVVAESPLRCPWAVLGKKELLWGTMELLCYDDYKWFFSLILEPEVRKTRRQKVCSKQYAISDMLKFLLVPRLGQIRQKKSPQCWGMNNEVMFDSPKPLSQVGILINNFENSQCLPWVFSTLLFVLMIN